MHKILKILPLAAMLALGACSSMEPEDDFERYGNFLAPDFDLAKFSSLNPDVAALQVIDTIKLLNSAWEAQQKESLTQAQITSSKTVDNNAFFSGDGKTIAKNYLKWTDAIVNTAVAEARPADTTAQGRWLRFNIYGENNELAFLESFLQTKLDSSLILQTYVMYSRKDGRPYRECKSSELANEVKNIDMEGVIVTQSGNRYTYDYSELFFCDDNGVVRKATNFSKN
jgi:hypothetical protein